MAEYNLGKVDEIEGFDEYIKEKLADKNKEIRKLELEMRRLHMIIRLQKEIIDNYKELAEIINAKMVTSQWNDAGKQDIMI